MAYEQELSFLKSLAVEAGDIMQQHFRSADTQHSYKKVNDPLTIADTTINSLVIERSRAQFPDHGVLGEEEIYHSDAANLWVIDPVDGTLPYVLGLPTPVFMGALALRGRPVVGVIYNPWMDLMYSAVEGEGAFCNERKLQITTSDTKIVELMLWKGSVYKEKVKPLRERLEEAGLSPQNMVGGIAKTALLENHLYGLVYADDSPWDIAPFDLMVHEAGGVVTDLDGQVLDIRQPINGAIAGSRETHAQLLELINAV